MRRRRQKMEGAAANSSPPNVAAPSLSSANFHNQDVKDDDLYEQLWRACAGTSVYVPREGDKVFYFPQGHLEQVVAFTQHQQDGQMDIPKHDLSSKILCRVVSVQLKAEAYTDEVFAQVTLLPESKQDELSLEDEDVCEIPSRASTNSFSKVLTASDSSTHGGFSIPRRHADECFGPLDMSLQPPTKGLTAKDLHGFEWHFRHIYRGQPKRHLLTTGWSTFVNSKKLAAGDACIFLSGENGELRVGVRRAVRQHNKASTFVSLISSHSMQLGILASASYAITTGSMFTVYYHPWKNPFEFIIPVKHYMKSNVKDYSVGTRVQMLFEVEGSIGRYTGTVIGNGDTDRMRWPGSEWRSLEVKWDTILDTYMHPERVCPWWIEPLESTQKDLIPILSPPKRLRVINLPLLGLSGLSNDDIVYNSSKATSQCVERDLQGQDYNARGCPQPKQKLQLFTNAQFPFHQSVVSSMPFPHEDVSTESSNVNSNISESHGWPSSESKDENDVSFGQPGCFSRYKLFGVTLIGTRPELPSPQFAVFSSKIPMSQTTMSATIPATKPYESIAVITSEKTCKKCLSVNSRSCTKVLKQGTALGRAIDLARFSGYEELIVELDWMFDFGGSLINGSSGWHVTCIDDDGDMTLLRDFPWQDFQSMVQKLIICPKDGNNNLNASNSDDPRSL